MDSNPVETDDEQTENSSFNNTRRQFVVGSAGALGGLALGSSVAGSALGQEDGEGGGEEQADDTFEDDVEILNYALTLEYLEARFYKQGLDNLGEEGLCNCEALEEDSYLQEVAYDRLRTIQAHEEAHVETLRSVIQDLGGEPVEEPTFDFGLAVEYPMAFLGTAAQLEDVGVSAYAGAAPSIENADLVPPALGIHSVEARHASFLRTLSSQVPFPEVVDAARTKSEVLEIASQFIVPDDGTGEPTPEPTSTPPANGTETPPANGTDTNTEGPGA